METRVVYEAPAVREIGTLSELTLMPEKHVGNSDGFTFNGQNVCQPGLNCS